MKSNNQPTGKKQPWYKGRLDGVKGVVAFLLILAVVRGGIYAATRWASEEKGNGSISEQTKTLLSSDELKEYVSPENNFKVNFPGFPAIERTSLPVGEYNVPYTTYLKEVQDGEAVYIVAVIDYKKIGFTSADLDLEGAYNGAIQNINGKTISSKTIDFQGKTAIEGVATANVEGKDYDVYLRIVDRGDGRFYMAATIGTDKNDYQAVADSMRFTD